MRTEARQVLVDYATAIGPSSPNSLACAQRQNALRQLVAVSPDFQVC
jgi:hypothetical protein